MKKLYPSLFVATTSTKDSYSFSFLLKRKAGNLLIACAPVDAHYEFIDEQGGVAAVLLTDVHFAKAYHGEICARFKVPLYCHKMDRTRVVEKTKSKAVSEFPEDMRLGADLTIIHTPGHAKGGVSYLWKAHKRFLFTGDFLCAKVGKWTVFPMGNPDIIRKSLALTESLEFDCILPGWASGVELSHLEVSTKAQKRAVIEQALSTIR